MRTNLSSVLISFLFIFWSDYSMSGSVSENEAQCTKEWNALEAKTKTSPEALNYWISLKNKKCAETGSYYYKLGWLQMALKNYDDARKSFNLGMKKPTNYRKELELSVIDIYAQKGAMIEKDRKLNFALAEKGYKLYIKKYPKYGSGYSQIADLMLMKENMEKVIEYGEKALEFKALKPPYRSMAIAYQSVGNPKKSIEN